MQRIKCTFNPGVYLPLASTWWRVLDVDRETDTALLIADKEVCKRKYHVEFEDVTWETCDLRKWLNSEYFETAFSEEEKCAIIETERENLNNPEYHTSGGSQYTTDRVFLLSIEEAGRYFKDDSDRSIGSWWWLRSPGYDSSRAASVDCDGSVHVVGSYVDRGNYTVRPAIIINLKSDLFQSMIEQKSEKTIIVRIPAFIIKEGVLLSANPGVQTAEIPEVVTNIGSRAFYGCSSLTSVTIPESVTSIGEEAFHGCCSLTNVAIPKGLTNIGVRVFAGCHGLEDAEGFLIVQDCLYYYSGYQTSITIPEGVTSIGTLAFYDRSSLRSVTIPDCVENIGDYAFYGCSNLTSITIPEGVTSIGSRTFYGCSNLTSITILEGVTNIGDEAFYGCSNLTSITIPEGVTSIGSRAFYGCYSLTSITIPEGVTSIGENAFRNCSSLTSVTIPESVTSIGYNAFYECGNLTSVSIPNNVTKIGDYAFKGCSSLTTITLPDSIVSYGHDVFSTCKNAFFNITEYGANRPDNFVIEQACLKKYKGLGGHVIVPDGVSEIGKKAFKGCSSLTSIVLPETVKKIRDEAFLDCCNLTSIQFPEGLQSIGSGVFGGCSSIIALRAPFMTDHSILPERTSMSLLKTSEDGPSFYAVSTGSDSDNINDYVITGNWSAYDLELINNGPKYKYKLPARLMGALGRLLEPVELSEENRNLLFELLKKNVKKIIPIAESLNCPEIVTALFDLGLVNKSNEKSIRKLLLASQVQGIAELGNKAISSVQEEASQKIKDTAQEPTLSPQEEAIKQKYKSINGDKLLKKMKLTGVTMPAVKWKDGTPASDIVFRYILASYASQKGSTYHFDDDADAAAELLSYDSLCAAMEAVSGNLDGPNYPAVLPLLCRFGNQKQIRTLTRAWKDWGNWAKYNRKGREAQTVLEESIILSDTREAVLWLEKRNQLEVYASLRGIETAQVYEQYLFDLGLDENGNKCFDLGTTVIEVSLTEDLKIILRDKTTDKVVRSIPKKNVDPAVQKAASNELADLRQNLNKIIRLKTDQLFQDFLSGAGTKPAQWTQSYMNNPLLRRIASLLVWMQGDATFTVSDSGIIDSHGDNYTVTEEKIRLAHPIEMKERDIRAWQDYFVNKGLKQPFEQIWEPAYDPGEITSDRYTGSTVRFRYLVNRSKHGINAKIYDAYEIVDEINLRDCRIRYKIDEYGEYSLLDTKAILGEFTFRRYTRQVNHIVYMLDKVTVYGRLEKDDTSISKLLARATFTQVQDYIRAANENSSTNCLALLLEEKNRRWPEYDGVGDLLLE